MLATNPKVVLAFSPEVWPDAPLYNLPSVGACSTVRPAFLRLPTATHESFGHSCSRWGEMSPRWQSFCVHVCPSFLPHKRVLLLYKWPGSCPRANAGKAEACGRSSLYVNARLPSIGQLVVMYVIRLCVKTHWTEAEAAAFYNLVMD